MGDILRIRVMAQSGSEEEVAETWPTLCSLVWPDWMNGLKLKTAGLDKLLAPVLGPGPVEKFLGGRKHGVVELASDLADLLQFGNLPPEIVENLRSPAAKVGEVNRALAKALSDWGTQEANSLTDQLENALDAAEKELGKLIRSKAKA